MKSYLRADCDAAYGRNYLVVLLCGQFEIKCSLWLKRLQTLTLEPIL